jgi:hypothetical protein
MVVPGRSRCTSPDRTAQARPLSWGRFFAEVAQREQRRAAESGHVGTNGAGRPVTFKDGRSAH